jgi:diketogulonate reductase-like aldo/keto reductase
MIFDFELSAADMHAIDSLNRNEHIGPTPENFRDYFRKIGV